jgi:hypothetical protein
MESEMPATQIHLPLLGLTQFTPSTTSTSPPLLSPATIPHPTTPLTCFFEWRFKPPIAYATQLQTPHLHLNTFPSFGILVQASQSPPTNPTSRLSPNPLNQFSSEVLPEASTFKVKALSLGVFMMPTELSEPFICRPTMSLASLFDFSPPQTSCKPTLMNQSRC